MVGPDFSLNPKLINFETNQASIRRSYAALAKAGFRKPDIALATTTGVRETYENFGLRVSAVPSTGERCGIELGPGHLAPAQIIVKEMSDPAFRHCAVIQGTSPANQ